MSSLHWSTNEGVLTQEKSIFGTGMLGQLQDDNALLLFICKQLKHNTKVKSRSNQLDFNNEINALLSLRREC